MEEDTKIFALNINNLMQERKNIVKSVTDAASKMFTQLGCAWSKETGAEITKDCTALGLAHVMAAHNTFVNLAMQLSRDNKQFLFNYEQFVLMIENVSETIQRQGEQAFLKQEEKYGRGKKNI
jgi:hypothetical protein